MSDESEELTRLRSERRRLFDACQKASVTFKDYAKRHDQKARQLTGDAARAAEQKAEANRALADEMEDALLYAIGGRS